MVGTIAVAIVKASGFNYLTFENLTIWNPTFKKSGFQMFPNFEWSGFRSPLYSIIQILTVLSVKSIFCDVLSTGATDNIKVFVMFYPPVPQISKFL